MAGNSKPVQSSPSKLVVSAYDLPPTRHSATQIEKSLDSDRAGVTRTSYALRPFRDLP
jgi:hypothetical protein